MQRFRFRNKNTSLYCCFELIYALLDQANRILFERLRVIIQLEVEILTIVMNVSCAALL